MNTILVTKQSRQYWLEELKPPLSGWDLYTDYPKYGQARKLQRTTYALDLNVKQLKEALQGKGELRAWMLACYYVFLHRMTGEQDLILGVRSSRGNLLPVRMLCEGDSSFSHLYQGILDKLSRAEANCLPLAEITSIAGSIPELEAIYGLDEGDKPGLLHWEVKLEGQLEQAVIHIAYPGNLFKEATIRRYGALFQQIAAAALEDDSIAIGKIPLLTEEDVAAYARLNETARALPNAGSIPAFLEITMKRFPNRIALSSGLRKVTYAELDAQSNQVAQMLVSRGLVPGDFVGIFMERSLEAIIGMLGVLKAGGAYVPLDPEHPDDRNAYIIQDTSSAIIITKKQYYSKVTALLEMQQEQAGQSMNLRIDQEQMHEEEQRFSSRNVFCLDSGLDQYTDQPVGVTASVDDVAYVIYTSGTTGRPKGVLIPHIGVINLAAATVEQLGLHEQDVILQYSTFSFDASVYDIFSALHAGARLHLLSGDERYSVEAFTAAIESTGATRFGILPTVFFNQLSTYLTEKEAYKYKSIQSLVIGGEALTGAAVRAFQKKLEHKPMIVNAYGPTEATVVTTIHPINDLVPDNISMISIGRPIANYEVFIVNEHNQLCPQNVIGELLISSVGLAKGYLNQQDKTDEVFIPDPIAPASGKTFYRSGDLVRLQGDVIEYMGRKDLQVKIRGYRIEIGEIEDTLAKYEGIKDVAVIAKDGADGSKMLVAFYTSRDGGELSRNELQTYLKSKLPAYMVPSIFIAIEAMPVSPTGKIDRKQLLLYEYDQQEAEEENYIPPENELQREVSAAWEKVLGRARIGIHEDFFEAGGHSLKILETLVLLKPKFPGLRIGDFFAYPTIAKLAERAAELADEGTEGVPGIVESSELVDLLEHPLQFGGQINQSRSYSQQHILLTGATGYLGSRLLYELLQQSESMIYCLVRSVNGSDPDERLRNVMATYFGSEITNHMNSRVRIVIGDLEQEGLGLSDSDYKLLREQIDSVVHCGAEVRHFGDEEYFRRVNVDSTERLLALGQGKDNFRFHYISTLGIPEDLAMGGQWDSFTASEAYDYNACIDNVYTNSKLEAEKRVVRVCEEDGVPVTVYRVGNLSCDSKNGVFQTNIGSNAFYRMLKAMLLLGRAPRVKWQVDITPIDYAGEAVAALLLQNETVGRMFHICNPVQINYEEMIDQFRDYGYYISLVDWPEYEAWLLDASQPKDQQGMELAMAQLEGDGAKNSIYRYGCPQTLQYLEGTGISCAVPDRFFFRRLIDHAVAVGYFDRPN
ncbi:non-ribosomal peptide synthetase [Paenibacillus lentus]|uniref:Amino acid adenylation domain-containing protein n=1 Tax=Paenibacillus lentus TaxID=1338368 RepID=A0A3Q8S3W8_9BACL|nr:non-ribosomal peptide synthetase [Paenibacillus lentus]AZK45528.1 amino acid adenylation domain-containing protein [Paenibacillus lentus]